jgi:glycosyltransferase involved in cell wall biosynthesis
MLIVETWRKLTIGKTVNALKTIYIDARCLQDANYQGRGIGRLSENLLLTLRIHLKSKNYRVIGIVDPRLPDLMTVHRNVFDAIHVNGYCGGEFVNSVFLQLSPMTHDPLFISRYLGNKNIYKASIIYDFIPLLFPDRYIASTESKIAYQIKMSWLSKYDHFYPISKYTSDELVKYLNISPQKITLTSAPVDTSKLQNNKKEQASPFYILATGGDDPRKNIECAILAHATSNKLQESAVHLIITGGYSLESRQYFQKMYDESGGRPNLFTMPGHVSDDRLADLYGSSSCVIVASKAEGFSIPVVEAMASGAPVVASNIPAHAELVHNDNYLFDPDSYLQLQNLIEKVVFYPEFRTKILSDQNFTSSKFDSKKIANDFWTSLENLSLNFQPNNPNISKHTRPKIAFISPFPPDRSGVADYSAATVRELGKIVDVHAFSPRSFTPLPNGASSIQPLSILPHISNRFDRVIGVVGNSHFHFDIVTNLLNYGGCCIEHDNRLLGLYRAHMGDTRTRSVASKELNRDVNQNDIENWTRDEATIEATLIGELATACLPICVHSLETAKLINQRFGIDPVLLPFSIYRDFSSIQDKNKLEVRRQLGMSTDEFIIATFGFIEESKSPVECIQAIGILNQSMINAHLYFVGDVFGDLSHLHTIVDNLGLNKKVTFISKFIDEETYKDYFCAADAGIQLRKHRLGGLSGALLDCIGAGLPTVSNKNLANSMNAPTYVTRVPDSPDMIEIANALRIIYDRRETQAALFLAEKNVYIDNHNFKTYTQKLCQALSLTT